MRWTIGVALLISICANTATWAQSAAYHFIRSDNPIQDKNVYLLTLLAKDPVAREAIARSSVMQDVGRRLTKSRDAVYSACKEKVCSVNQLMLTQAETERVGDELGSLAGAGGPLNRLVEEEMRPSGRFQKYADMTASPFMRAAWLETAQGVNHLYRVYALGEKVPSSSIDGALYEPGSDNLISYLQSALGAEIDGASTDVFFSPWAQLGFDLLTINQRTEAGRYEPLEDGENARAFAAARTVDWKSKRYAAIVVPGVGLSDGEVGVSPKGAFRLRMAARRWRDGFAPFIIVSGGHVHPNRTPYSEAVEMKRELITRYQIPEAAIVIDPYARHTTTNLRNATRLLFRMGAPMTTPMVITASEDASQYIESRSFADRCATELGYRPVEIVRRASPFDLEARPNIISLHADPKDPLDP